MKNFVTLDDALCLLLENDNSESVICFDYVEAYTVIEYLFDVTTREIDDRLELLKETYECKEEYKWGRLSDVPKKKESEKDIEKLKQLVSKHSNTEAFVTKVGIDYALFFDCPLRSTRENMLGIIEVCGFKLVDSEMNTKDGYMRYKFK